MNARHKLRLADPATPQPDAPASAGVPPGMTPAADITPLLRIQDIARRLTVSVETVTRMRASGRLPRPDLVVGKRSPRWTVSTINNWIAKGGKLS
jgi:predicted DNA-binding transcriptional regulator AlpA